MRIGYPCLNRSIGCSPSKTFRLASYTDERLEDTVSANLSCMKKILAYNAEHGLLFLRITSDIVPFASHEVCTFPWQETFAGTFSELGDYCQKHGFRISMHPDQFVLLNAPDERVLARSIADLAYQTAVLDLMGLDRTAKVQIHVGGVYGDKAAAMDRFAKNYRALPPEIRARLVIENDERLYSAADCLALNARTKIPIILDTFHHSLNNNGEPVNELFSAIRETWHDRDGIPMVDYSSQQGGKRTGAHAETLDPENFRQFLSGSQDFDFDLMPRSRTRRRARYRHFPLRGGTSG
jgi:UV DNA damage endonuclease